MQASFSQSEEVFYRSYNKVYCYMTPIKTSSDWLKLACTGCEKSCCQTVMSSDLYASADRQLKIDCPKSSPCDIDFFHCYLTAKNRHWNTDWFLVYISQVKCLFIFMRTAFNPFMQNGISHHFLLEQSISVWRDVRWYFSFLFKF